MDDSQVPSAEPPPAPRWVLVDVVAAVLTAVAWATQIAAGGPVMPAGPGRAVVRYLAAGAACASIVFRWRFPVAALGVVGASVALVSALGGHGARDGSSLVLIPVTLAVYTVVATAAKRTALAAVGAAVALIEAGAFVAAGGADETVVVSAPALAT